MEDTFSKNTLYTAKDLIGKGYNIDNFFPKSYDLNDQIETEDFLGIILILEEFKFNQAISLLIHYNN